MGSVFLSGHGKYLGIGYWFSFSLLIGETRSFVIGQGERVCRCVAYGMLSNQTHTFCVESVQLSRYVEYRFYSTRVLDMKS